MKIESLHTDCMLYMPKHPDKKFSIGSADPPYFEGVGKLRYFGRVNSSINVKRGDYDIPEWDSSIPDINFFNELKRVSVNQIIWGANYYDFIGPVHATPKRKELKAWLSDHPTGWIVWDKKRVEGTAFNDFELAWTSFDRPTVIFEFLWNGMLQGKNLKEPTVMQGNKKKNEKRIHPTQKPTGLYKWLLLNYAGPCETILETHGGSFSMAIASYDLNFCDLVICEKNLSYFNSGQRRLADHISKYSPASQMPVTPAGEFKLF